MNETAKTGVFTVVAVAAVIIAYFARPAAPEREAFDDSGERFFAEFDPLDASSLEIVSWDDETAVVKAFKVARINGVWSIPSHEDYPADAEQQLANAAASVVDLVRGPKVSDRAADHELLGVVDPVGENTAGAGGALGSGIGTRVTMKNAAGGVLADFIVGKPVKDSNGLRYLRLPERDRVYSVKVDTKSLTTRFEEWIEDDLLLIDPLDIRSMVINDYTIDEINQRILQGDVLEMIYDEGSSSWSMDGLAAGETLRSAKVNELKQAIDGLKIIDVHRKPAGLSAELRSDDALELDNQAVRSLSRRGFYIAGNALVSNQGETLVNMEDGVTYVLRFGEIAAADRAGSVLDAEEEAETAADEGAARYLFVAVQFNPDTMPQPVYEPLPDVPDVSAAAAASDAEAPDDEAAQKKAEEIASFEALRERVKSENDEKREDYEQSVEAARERVAELNDRFADWYYVISDSVYRKVRLQRTDLVETTPATPPGG